MTLDKAIQHVVIGVDTCLGAESDSFSIVLIQRQKNCVNGIEKIREHIRNQFGIPTKYITPISMEEYNEEAGADDE